MGFLKNCCPQTVCVPSLMLLSGSESLMIYLQLSAWLVEFNGNPAQALHREKIFQRGDNSYRLESGVLVVVDLILYVHSTIFQLCGTCLPGLNQY